jgi:hypothetical protein
MRLSFTQLWGGVLFAYTCLFVQVFFIVDMLLVYFIFVSLICMLLRVYFRDTCFCMQVFIVVRAYASNACVPWTLAVMCKYVLSSVHMLLMHALHGHLLLCTSIFCRPYTCL